MLLPCMEYVALSVDKKYWRALRPVSDVRFFLNNMAACEVTFLLYIPYKI